MADKPSTQDTIKNFLSDIADSSNRAFNEFLDPPSKSNKSNTPDWFSAGYPLAALAGTPAGALQALAAISGGANPMANPLAALAGVNPLAALAGAGAGDRDRGPDAANLLGALAGAAGPLAALAGAGGRGAAAANPLAALAGAANPLAALTNPLGAVGQLAGTANDLGGLAESLATLPQQLARLTDLLATLVGALDAVKDVAGAAGVVRQPVKK
ncbi:hypothetical protein ACLVWQ_34485 [Streptomyces sp. CWNU-52B]|uniref:hypothetical protein n=1 Tax=unclassified Streptomyces TaxID=2593676 RepID=UPI0039C440F2